MSQKRVMQLVISRIGQLNTTLFRIENVLIDAFLDLAARADPEKTGLAAEDAEVRSLISSRPPPDTSCKWFRCHTSDHRCHVLLSSCVPFSLFDSNSNAIRLTSTHSCVPERRAWPWP